LIITIAGVSTFLVNRDFAMSATLNTLTFLKFDAFLFCLPVHGLGGDCNVETLLGFQ